MESQLLEVARAAMRAGDAAAARTALDGLEPCGAVLELRAGVFFVLFDYARAAEEYEQAYAAYRAEGRAADAARMARILGAVWLTGIGDWAVAGGWIARAKTLLSDQPSSSERGWVALTEGMFAASRERKHEAFRVAIEIGREIDDAELTYAAMAYLGASLVHDDRTEEGMVLLDESLAAVAGAEVDDFFVVEEMFCQLMSACEYAHDVTRAEQWIRVGERIAARRGLPSVAAYCRTHYGAILTAAGRWPEADAALTEAVRLWASGRRTLEAGALCRLADLRVRQGRYDEAALLLEGLSDPDAARPRAALLLAQGQTHVAKDLLEHAARRADPDSSASLPLLSLLVEARVACGEDPGPTFETLARCAEAHPSPYATAVVALARARAGRGDVRSCLRDAFEGFTAAGLPLEASLCRLDLAEASRATDPEVALSEARSALSTFERLEAARHVDAARALLRSLGGRARPPRPAGGTLTRREDEVLRLIGEGLSNPEIAERLFISRKTVEHHVGNVLAKLGLRNRAEAAAYAVRRKPAAG